MDVSSSLTVSYLKLGILALLAVVVLRRVFKAILDYHVGIIHLTPIQSQSLTQIHTGS